MPVIFKSLNTGVYLKLRYEAVCSICNTLDDSIKMQSEIAEVLIKKPEESKIKKPAEPKIKKPEEPLTLF